MTIKSLVGIVADTTSQHIVIKTEEGEESILLGGNTPMDDLLEQKRFIGYNAKYTSNGAHYRIEFHKEFTNHIIYGSLRK